MRRALKGEHSDGSGVDAAGDPSGTHQTVASQYVTTTNGRKKDSLASGPRSTYIQWYTIRHAPFPILQLAFEPPPEPRHDQV